MQAANFTCESCLDETTTLHVHHRIYRKGRDPWEYERSELACICERCHDHETAARAALAEALITLDESEIEHITGYADGWALLKAWHYERPTSDLKLESNQYAAGLAAVLKIDFPDLMRLVDRTTGMVSVQALKDLHERGSSPE